ncbi:unnamed protein product [Microthlaspi erraticum]|uniref:SKP1-like protein n=1 Tax=Microthlaspi erraticum TaxID=1685480 RepID=A0A6D2JN99_9BRAS|nr:unnamed protein product [Microthlaspi erraticum]
MSTSKKKTLLVSSDGEEFEIDEAIAVQSRIVAAFYEEEIDEAIAVPNNRFTIENVTGSVLSKVIAYLKKHAVSVGDGGESSSSSSAEEDLKKWDAEFMETDQKTIFDLMLAANYLTIKPLLDLTCKTVASMILACKDVDEVRERFNIVNDYTPEEEAEVRKENQWAFE